MRIIDHNYYEPAYLSYLIRIGEIIEPKPVHNKPEDYGLSTKDAINIRIRYLRTNLTSILNEFNACKTEYMQEKRPYGYITMNYLQEKIDKLKKDIYFNRQRLKGGVAESINVEALRRVPLDRITKINSNRFFQDNPFRNEKSPSNSLYWYKNNNRWQDFGSGKSGDAVDLVMALYNCDFKTACKNLSTDFYLH